jgi:hypothetical protein
MLDLVTISGVVCFARSCPTPKSIRMAPQHQQTSLISILSSDHGRMRREQRDISKRDLQKALKYGIPERTWGYRWKIEYDGIIFIADNARRKEVTAYPAPLKLADVDQAAMEAHDLAKQLIELKPELCVTHSVLVVDNSGSMTMHDIILHRDRQTAAYSTIALEFVAEQLLSGTANNSDVVSLVEFSDTSRVVFTHEPVSWALYNKLLSRRDVRCFKTREDAKAMELFRCDSNYLPAIAAAEELLENEPHEGCALSFFFLSDGAPSDWRNLGMTPQGASNRICSQMEKIASRFGGRITMTMVGFGNAYGDFSVLEAMAKAVNDVPNDAKASFVFCDKTAHAMGVAITSHVTSLTSTRTSLQDARIGSHTRRDVASEHGTEIMAGWRHYLIEGHFLFDPASRTFVCNERVPPGALRGGHDHEANPPSFLAMSTRSCGEGAERVAFRCLMVDSARSIKSSFGAMVAKETNLVEYIDENIEFHRTFCATQSKAASLAKKFNLRLQALPGYNQKTTPRILFLECSILSLVDSEWPGGLRAILVEKFLDTDTEVWRKWNDNAGAVNGKSAHIPIDVVREMAELVSVKLKALDIIAEGESDEDSESSEESFDNNGVDEPDADTLSGVVNPSDYLQAFTHYTYKWTRRKLMVCDLQGVYKADDVPPTFELTDPAIHYASKRRRTVYCRTDKGRKGIQLFLKTHRCSAVCNLMQLGKKRSGDMKRRTEP